ncbi:hypothetical protein F3Y22_tig00111005pilonHSYRG00057 [Hibiscus syriacus]|uniref:ABC transmembrane type-1 domain-containing protein n=1 Tax=Hibiscus syriacus TaxID=106335 RepID=A0A6A2Z961_HIBSY|nr:hypothetical protein F3Y22_tig00111005pilonHSYRG00057 [Hibiscus syriacus]
MASKCGGGGLLRYADGIDKLLLLFGTLGSIGDGMMSPVNMYILSGALNDYGSADQSFSNDVVDKYALRLLYSAIGVGISAFIERVCWTRCAERQASRMRVEYLKSVLRQEVGFFDDQTASSSSFQVVSTVTSDVHSIQDTIADKVCRLPSQLLKKCAEMKAAYGNTGGIAEQAISSIGTVYSYVAECQTLD